MRTILLTICAVLFTLSPCVAQDKQQKVLVPKVISAPDAIYPQEAIDLGYGGSVRVEVNVDKTGNVTVIQAFGPNAPCSDLADSRIAPLRQAAMDAAKNTVFEPPMLDGKTVEKSLTMTFKIPFPKIPESEKGVPRYVAFGTLNGKVTSLAAPTYPDKAKQQRVGGSVILEVLIGEDGKVIAANAVSGHPLLREAATVAACKSKFSPTAVQGHPLMVTGTVTYNFVP